MGQLHDLSFKQSENGDQELFIILLLMLNIRTRRSGKPIVIISRDGPSIITGERELSVMAGMMTTSNLDKKHQENIITFVVVLLEINYFVMALKT
jgi:hypothetical protein